MLNGPSTLPNVTDWAALRISEACNARIEDLHQVGDQTWLHVTCKGNVRRSVPLVAPPATESPPCSR